MSTVKNPLRRLVVVVLLVAICCLVFPLASLIRILYTCSADEFEDVLIQTIQTETKSYANLLEKELGTIMTQTRNVPSEEEVRNLRYRFEMGTQNIETSLRLQTLQSQMAAVQNSHTLIQSMALYYPELLRKVTVNSQAIYHEEKEQICQIVNESFFTGIWNDKTRLICWNTRYDEHATQAEDMQVIATSVITADNMKKYLKNYLSDNTDNCFAVFVSGEKEDFFVSTDTRLGKNILPHPPSPSGYSVQGEGVGQYLLTWDTVQDNITLYQMVPLGQVYLPINEYQNTMRLFFVIAGCFILLFVMFIYITVHKPVEHARQTFKRMEKGELGVQMGNVWYLEFQGMYQQFNSMSRRIQYLIEQEYEQRILNVESQMKALQYQIKPHFLYNSYLVLQGLLEEEEYDQAILMTGFLGRYLKYITASGNEGVPLKEQLEYVRDYAGIQQMRFAGRVTVNIGECPFELEQFLLPKLMIQPLLENAFNHGVRDKLSGGLIQIRVVENDNGFCIGVEDNGEGLTDEKLEELEEMIFSTDHMPEGSVALMNIHKRLVLRYGQGSGLCVSRSALGGLRCELRIITEAGEAEGIALG